MKYREWLPGLQCFFISLLRLFFLLLCLVLVKGDGLAALETGIFYLYSQGRYNVSNSSDHKAASFLRRGDFGGKRMLHFLWLMIGPIYPHGLIIPCSLISFILAAPYEILLHFAGRGTEQQERLNDMAKVLQKDCD